MHQVTCHWSLFLETVGVFVQKIDQGDKQQPSCLHCRGHLLEGPGGRHGRGLLSSGYRPGPQVRRWSPSSPFCCVNWLEACHLTWAAATVAAWACQSGIMCQCPLTSACSSYSCWWKRSGPASSGTGPCYKRAARSLPFTSHSWGT